MTLRDEITDLAGQIDPTTAQPAFRVSTEPWPAHLAERGLSRYVDEHGTTHFTIRIDHREQDHEPGR